MCRTITRVLLDLLSEGGWEKRDSGTFSVSYYVHPARLYCSTVLRALIGRLLASPSASRNNQ